MTAKDYKDPIIYLVKKRVDWYKYKIYINIRYRRKVRKKCSNFEKEINITLLKTQMKGRIKKTWWLTKHM